MCTVVEVGVLKFKHVFIWVLIPPWIDLYEIFCNKKSTKNYCDENGFTYTKKTLRVNALYLRCKHSQSGCKASVICKGNNLQKAILSIPHSHVALEKDKDDLKFRKMLEHLILENPFKQLMDIYNDAKEALFGQINLLHIGEIGDYNVFMWRKLKENLPLLPNTIQEFEDLINDPGTGSNTCLAKTNYSFMEYGEGLQGVML